MSQSNPSGSDVSTTRPQFTQGELVTHIGQDGGLFIRDKESHRLIAGFQTSTLNERMPEGEGEANAALFMASRDMLAALKAQELRQTNQPNPFGHECNWCGECCDRVIRMRRDAIAKAEER